MPSLRRRIAGCFVLAACLSGCSSDTTASNDTPGATVSDALTEIDRETDAYLDRASGAVRDAREVSKQWNAAQEANMREYRNATTDSDRNRSDERRRLANPTR